MKKLNYSFITLFYTVHTLLFINISIYTFAESVESVKQLAMIKDNLALQFTFLWKRMQFWKIFQNSFQGFVGSSDMLKLFCPFSRENKTYALQSWKCMCLTLSVPVTP